MQRRSRNKHVVALLDVSWSSNAGNQFLVNVQLQLQCHVPLLQSASLVATANTLLAALAIKNPSVSVTRQRKQSHAVPVQAALCMQCYTCLVICERAERNIDPSRGYTPLIDGNGTTVICRIAFKPVGQQSKIIMHWSTLQYCMQCNAMQCNAMPCHAMPCHAMPCHSVAKHSIAYHGMACLSIA